MKKPRFFLIGLLIGATLVSCSEKPDNLINPNGKDVHSINKNGENFATLITPAGTDVLPINNNGGNVTCEEVAKAEGCDFEHSSGRMDYSGGEGGTYGPITWTTDGTYVSWVSTVPIKVAVIVKGGPNANVYFSGCDECLTSGSSLSAPINPKNGKPYGLSNITFCYSECGSDLVIALKSYMTDYLWAVTGGGVDNGYFIGYETYEPGIEYPLYQEGQTDNQVGVLVIGNFDTDPLMEVKITSTVAGLKFTYPYLFVGTVEDFDIDFENYPYPIIKGDIVPPAAEVIIDLLF